MIFGQKKRWFTLVEMLIVIVIIWVLAAALIPRLTSVRWRANDVARKADVQQLATAVITYQMDNNGKFPDPSGAATWDRQSIIWISGSLITAWMDWLPVDPVPTNVFSLDVVGTLPVTTWSYGYMRLRKDGVDDNGFVLMAKAQTAWWANRVAVASWSSQLTWWSSTENLPVCKSIQKVASGSEVNNWWDCQYSTIAQLRYVMIR